MRYEIRALSEAVCLSHLRIFVESQLGLACHGGSLLMHVVHLAVWRAFLVVCCEANEPFWPRTFSNTLSRICWCYLSLLH